MMRQYRDIKDKNSDSILFFRLGDFYEMFFEDAKLASKELELTLTGRDCGQEERAPMCGVPYHSCEAYIERLVKKGYKVAICEQTENPAQARGLVSREVVRVVTPGTVFESNMLDESRNNYLCAVCMTQTGTGLCFVDASTGEMHLTTVNETAKEAHELRVINEIGRFLPREVLLNNAAAGCENIIVFLQERISCRYEALPDEAFSAEAANKMLLSHFNKKDVLELGIDSCSVACCAAGVALNYLYRTRMTGLQNISEIDVYSENEFMRLDVMTRRNLELCETMRGKDKRGSLLWVLDKTKTAMGKRLIRSWLEQPLINITKIGRRQNAVSELCNDSILLCELTDQLGGIYDMERIMTRIVYGTANCRELKALSCALSKMPQVKATLSAVKSKLLSETVNAIDPLEDIVQLVESAIVDEPPATVREGGMFKDGYSQQLDTLRNAMRDGKGFIAAVEQNEREKTGIKALKIGYNRVFGYYIEVTNSYKRQVPETYIRKQTLSNCERYITGELKELESTVLGAKESAVALEYELFEKLRKTVAEAIHRIQQTAGNIGVLDVLASFATVAAANGYVCPRLTLDGRINIKDGRHPVVELMQSTVPFVPNDALLDKNENRCAIITGPNMAGKSTYMRQIAVISLMAQTGSFVPAKSADICMVDAIFTRVGASDDLSMGQSTFMVEMNEVAHILKNATGNSLIILDEIGRGTSTFDGMSIARAVLEYAADKKRLGAKTLFATHYHELTELESILDGVVNYNIAVKKRGFDITFLRRIVRGGADDSYGIEVAKLAGVPNSVVTRAKAILGELEESHHGARRGELGSPADQGRPAVSPAADAPEQISFSAAPQNALIEQLQGIDIDVLTPIEAMTKLYEFVNKAKKL